MVRTSRDHPRRRLSIGVKFALTTGLAATLMLAVGSAVIFKILRVDAAAQSEAGARSVAARVAGTVQSVFDSALGIVDSTRGDLIAMKENGIKDPAVYNMILRRIIDTGPDRYGAWFVWAPGRAPVALPAGATFKTYWHQNGMEIFQDQVPTGILESDLYRVPAETGHSYLLEPHAIDAVNGDPTLVTSFARPLGDDGKEGVLAVDLKLDSIADALSAIDLPTGSRFSVVSSGGVVAVSTTKSWAGRPLAVVDPGDMRDLTAARKGDGDAFVEGAGGARSLRSWTSIRFNGAKRPWYLLLEIPEQSVFSNANREKSLLILVPTTALVLILFLVLLTMDRLVARPLKALSAIITDLGDGQFGFAVPGCERSDEVGDIACSVEHLQNSRMEIARLKEENGEAEFRRETQRQHELLGISSRFSQTIKALVADLREAAATVDTQASDVSAKTDAAIDRLSEVSGASSFAKESFGAVATATLSLIATIADIDEKTQLGRETASRVEERLATTDESISDLKAALAHIDNASKLVSGIATQINLIALNATIEAARAGEAGRGFAVVAQEVKTLAMQSASATTAIGTQIAAVRNAFQGADGSVGDMRETFKEMATTSTDIVDALALQADATGEIRALVERARDRAQNVERDMAALMSSSSQIRGAADGMRRQSLVLSERVGGLSEEVDGFLRFLSAA